MVTPKEWASPIVVVMKANGKAGILNTQTDVLSRLPLRQDSMSQEEEDGNCFGRRTMRIRLDDICLSKKRLKQDIKRNTLSQFRKETRRRGRQERPLLNLCRRRLASRLNLIKADVGATEDNPLVAQKILHDKKARLRVFDEGVCMSTAPKEGALCKCVW
ncbi:hypothetical protein J6590_044492 [Homalodisca vitripennis]|nr:hypothetical protein J6590_044492 [Homalodisca vitripennis]